MVSLQKKEIILKKYLMREKSLREDLSITDIDELTFLKKKY